MQPHTDQPATTTAARQRGDEADLYERHHQALMIAVSHAINGGPQLIEDACQSAWTTLVRRQPDRASIFAWLYVVAIHEAHELRRRRENSGLLLSIRRARADAPRTGWWNRAGSAMSTRSVALALRSRTRTDRR